MSLMASVSRVSCFQALAQNSGLNHLLNFPYRLKVSDALSFPDPGKEEGICLYNRRSPLPGSCWRDNPMFKHQRENRHIPDCFVRLGYVLPEMVLWLSLLSTAAQAISPLICSHVVFLPKAMKNSKRQVPNS